MTRRRLALAFVAGAAVVLAACSSSPSTPKTVTTTTHASASVSAPTSTTTTAAAPTTTATSAAAPAACTHVTGSPSQGQGAAGTITGLITVTNTATTPCSVNGYALIALYSGSGAPLPVTMVNGLTVTISSAANGLPSTVTLAPGSKAQFAYQFSDVPVGAETSCPTSESAQVTMPGSTTASPTFQLAIAPCNNGAIRVSPVYASS